MGLSLAPEPDAGFYKYYCFVFRVMCKLLAMYTARQHLWRKKLRGEPIARAIPSPGGPWNVVALTSGPEAEMHRIGIDMNAVLAHTCGGKEVNLLRLCIMAFPRLCVFLNDWCSGFIFGWAVISSFINEGGKPDTMCIARLWGALLTAALNNMVKMVYQQPRQFKSTSWSRDDYSFPSSHAAALSYFVVWTTLLFVSSGNPIIPLTVFCWLSFLTYCVLYARVCIEFDHVWADCGYGCLLGAVMGVFFFTYQLQMIPLHLFAIRIAHGVHASVTGWWGWW